jgi:acyl carrier protein
MREQAFDGDGSVVHINSLQMTQNDGKGGPLHFSKVFCNGADGTTKQGWCKRPRRRHRPYKQKDAIAIIAMENLIQELKVKIVEILNLPDVSPDDIEVDGQLVGGDLGIDSIDVLEMVIMIEKDYGVSIDNKELGTKVFATLRTLAIHIQERSQRLPN